jgi:hypothetical protein
MTRHVVAIWLGIGSTIIAAALAVHFAAAQKQEGAITGSGSATSPVVLDSDQQAIANAVAAGQHVRIDGPRGPLHVWRPAGYHADGAATVLYVHGYYDTVDTAWVKHQLPEQFAMSGINATFIGVEGPSNNRQPVTYPNLVEVLQTVEHELQTPRASGPVVAFGHSGAFRTLEAWMDAPILDTIIALDAMYGENDEFAAWYAAGPHRRLITVGDDTLRWTEELALDIADTYTVDLLPSAYDQWPAGALAARHLYVRSQFSHMPLVTNGRVIPLLLRLLSVETLPTSPWQISLGRLPPPPLLGSGSSASKAP